MAAQALSSLVSSSEALTEMNNWSSVNSSDYNAIHGRLVYIRNLISGVIDWSDSSANSREIVESVLRSKHEAFSELPCPPIQTEIFLAIDRYFVNANPTDLSLDWAVVAAQNVIDGPRSLLPGNDALLAAAADLILSHRPSTQTALSLLSNPTEVGRLGILERITKLPPSISGEILHQILDVAIDRKNGEAVQIAALDAITSSSLGSAVLEGLSAEKRSAKSDLLVGLLESKCVPLKEAALPAAAWAISGLPRDSGMEGKNDMMGRLAREILDASAETQVCSQLALAWTLRLQLILNSHNHEEKQRSNPSYISAPTYSQLPLSQRLTRTPYYCYIRLSSDHYRTTTKMFG